MNMKVFVTMTTTTKLPALICLLLATCVPLIFLATTAEANGASYLDQVNNYLVDNEKTDDVQANLRVARDYLNEKRSDKFGVHVRVIDYLEKFLELCKLFEENTKCIDESYEIIKVNKIAVAGRDVTKDRLARVVDAAIRRHNKECAKRIQLQESQSLARVHRLALRLVEDYTDIAIQQLIASESSLKKYKTDKKTLYRELVNLPKTRVWRGEFEACESLYPRLVLENLKQLSSKDPTLNGSSLCRSLKDKGQVLYEKYIVKPCEHYVQEMASAMKTWKANMNNFDKNDAEFASSNEHLVRFQVCEHLINNDRLSLFESMRDAGC